MSTTDNETVAMYWTKHIFAVNNCQVHEVNIGSFCLLETDGGYIKYFSCLTAFKHITMKVGLRVDSAALEILLRSTH